MARLKIFEEGVEGYLRELGIAQEQIDELKFKELKKAVVARLRRIAALIKKDRLDDVERILDYSPAGDDMGLSNHFISFADLIGAGSGEGDIGQIISLLKRLSCEREKTE